MAKYTNLTASALVKTGEGFVAGVIVNSHTSGTLKLWDSTSAAGAVLVDTFTFAAGSGVYEFPQVSGLPPEFTTGLYATIGGTANITLVWK